MTPIKLLVATTFLIWHSSYSFADVKNTLVNEVDKNLTVKSLAVLPCWDNVGGLYSRAIETQIGSLISEGHRFSLIEARDTDPRLTLDDYEAQPALIRTLGQKNKVDGFVIAKVLKSEKSLDITLDFFLTSDGLLLASEKVEKDSRFQMADVNKRIRELYEGAVGKLPYKARVLSRQNQRVTLDIGSSDGIKPDSIVTVDHIIAIKRHPKFNFILSTEKEIVGKIKILKAEPKLSFGIIVQEKDRGVISVDSKVSGIDYINYPETDLNGQPSSTPGVFPKQDQASFGKNPREWKPDKQPSLGLVGLALGLGSTHYSLTLQNAGSITGDNGLYPQIQFRGELWITQNWFLGSQIRQGIYSMGNTLTSSTPGTLNANSGVYDLHFGYNFLLQDDFWGPQLKVSLGFYKYSLFVDATTPLGLTSTSYSGFNLGIGGQVPLDQDKIYNLEAKLTLALLPTLNETPASSAANSSPSITTLLIGGSYKLTNNFKARAAFDFDFYSATFTGTGTRSDTGQNTSQTLFTLLGGLDYYF